MRRVPANYAFIDGQNLYVSLHKHNLKIDYVKFRVYLREKYGVKNALYFMGYFDSNYKNVYDSIIKAGFILIFKKSYKNSKSIKRGNIDADMIFEIAKKLLQRNNPNKYVIVSGDADYFKIINYLFHRDKLLKVLLPHTNAFANVYMRLPMTHREFLSAKGVFSKICYIK